MKAYFVSLGFVLLASCNRVPESKDSPGREVASLSTGAAPVGGAAKGVIPPVNAPTKPGTRTASVSELGRARGDVGSNLAADFVAKGAAARAGRAVAECGAGRDMKCQTSADCATNEACVCRPDGGYSGCVPADCRTDDDCAGGSCTETVERQAGDLTCVSSRIGLHCSSPKDECAPGAGSCGNASDQACIFDTDSKRFACAPLCTEMPAMRTRAD